MFLLLLRQLPRMRIGPLLQFPHPPRAGPVLLTLLFFPLVPLSYRVLHGSIYPCPLIRYFCLLSAGVLQHFCIPDVSVERDILHVHLLLCHLALLKSQKLFFFFFNTGSKTITYFLKVWIWLKKIYIYICHSHSDIISKIFSWNTYFPILIQIK